jgi:hypothetical protein
MVPPRYEVEIHVDDWEGWWTGWWDAPFLSFARGDTIEQPPRDGWHGMGDAGEKLPTGDWHLQVTAVAHALVGANDGPGAPITCHQVLVQCRYIKGGAATIGGSKVAF